MFRRQTASTVVTTTSTTRVVVHSEASNGQSVVTWSTTAKGRVVPSQHSSTSCTVQHETHERRTQATRSCRRGGVRCSLCCVLLLKGSTGASRQRRHEKRSPRQSSLPFQPLKFLLYQIRSFAGWPLAALIRRYGTGAAVAATAAVIISNSLAHFLTQSALLPQNTLEAMSAGCRARISG